MESWEFFGIVDELRRFVCFKIYDRIQRGIQGVGFFFYHLCLRHLLETHTHSYACTLEKRNVLQLFEQGTDNGFKKINQFNLKNITSTECIVFSDMYFPCGLVLLLSQDMIIN